MSSIIASIEQFVAERMVVATGNTCVVQDVVAEWVAYNGSTTGKCKLYAHIKSIQGVSKVGTNYHGIAIAAEEEPVAAEEEPVAAEEEPVAAEEEPVVAEEEPVVAEEEPVVAAKNDIDQITDADMEGLTPFQRMEFKMRFAEMKAKLAAVDKENEAKLVAVDKENEAKLAAVDKEVAAKREKIASTERMHAEKLAFMREENNKNRKMFDDQSAHYSPYLDMHIYGNPAQQYVPCSSLKKVVHFSIYNRTFQLKSKDYDDIAQSIDECKEEVSIIDAQGERTEEVVDVENVAHIMQAYDKYRDVYTKAAQVPAIAKGDTRIVPCYYDQRIKRVMSRLDNGTNAKSPKEKIHYVRKLNQLMGDDQSRDGAEDSVEISVLCGACGKRIQLTDNECHRMHDVPNSSSRDWSTDNIYLGCSQCNLNMKTRLLLLYKIDLYTQRLLQEGVEV